MKDAFYLVNQVGGLTVARVKTEKMQMENLMYVFSIIIQ